MIIWLTGLSGAGKTTIGRCVYAQLKEHLPNTAFLDGDEVRDVFKFSHLENPYSLESRKIIGIQYHHMCRWLDRQGIHVVCCTICSFPEIRSLNRVSLSAYFEVFVDVPLEILVERDTKNLYKSALKHERKDVVGIDLPYSAPESPDVVIDNHGYDIAPDEHARRIVVATQLLAKQAQQQPTGR